MNSFLYSQINREWVKQYNGTANMYDSPARILIDNSSNIYVAGYSGVIQTTSGDYLLLKYSPSGNILWERTYDAANAFDGIEDALVDNNNNIYVTGESRLVSTNSDIYTMKFDSSGNVIWGRRYDGRPHAGDIPRKICVDNLGNIYVIALSSQYFNPVQTTGDILIIKYNSNGDSLWTAIYNNNGAYTEEDPASICISENGSVYITGQANSNSGYYDVITLKYDNNGEFQWSRRFNGTVNRDDFGSKVVCDLSGNIYVLGSTTSVLSENFDIVLIKYSENGDSLWTKKYNGIGNARDFGRDIYMDNHAVYITGESGYASSQNTDIVLLKYDLNGNLLKSSYFDGVAHMSDTPSKLVKDPYGYFFIVGSSARGVLNWDYVVIRYDSDCNQIWFDTFNSQGNSDDNGIDLIFGANNDLYLTGACQISDPLDIVTIKYNSVIGLNNMNQNVPVKTELSQNYPNPFNPTTNFGFRIADFGLVRLTVFDAIGREIKVLVNQQLQPGTYEVSWDASAYSSGVYFYKLTVTAGREVFTDTKKMLMIK